MKEPDRKFHAVAELFPLLEGEAFEDLGEGHREERAAGGDPGGRGGNDRRWAEPVPGVPGGWGRAALRGVAGRRVARGGVAELEPAAAAPGGVAAGDGGGAAGEEDGN